MQSAEKTSVLSQFLDAPGVMLDVRSPAEYQKGHIPGAVSFALFSDDERARIGTLYKQKGREPAVEEGLRVIGPRLLDIVQHARKLADDGQVKLYCWRGGMRSGSVAWLLKTAGFSVQVLPGGYKTYRTAAVEVFEGIRNLIVLQGATGSGKTDILHSMACRGEQVLDLEGLAHHRGSAFGALGQAEQPETQHFQNEIYRVLRSFDFNRRIWVEGESKSVGRCYLPDELWNQMARANVLEIAVPAELRVQRLVQEYGQFEPELLGASIQKLRKRLGGLRTQEALDLLAAGDLSAVARLLLVYYDDSYSNSRKEQNKFGQKPLQILTVDPDLGAQQILQYADQVWPHLISPSPERQPLQPSPSA